MHKLMMAVDPTKLNVCPSARILAGGLLELNVRPELTSNDAQDLFDILDVQQQNAIKTKPN